MKKLIVTVLMCIGTIGFAQQSSNNTKNKTSTAPDKIDMRVKKMVEYLNLDSHQEQELKTLYRSRPSTDNQTQSLQERKDFSKKLKEILTPEQLESMKSMRK